MHLSSWPQYLHRSLDDEARNVIRIKTLIIVAKTLLCGQTVDHLSNLRWNIQNNKISVNKYAQVRLSKLSSLFYSTK